MGFTSTALSILFLATVTVLVGLTYWISNQIADDVEEVADSNILAILMPAFILGGCLVIGIAASGVLTNISNIVTGALVLGGLCLAGLLIWAGIRFGGIATEDETINHYIVKYLMIQCYVLSVLAFIWVLVTLRQAMLKSHSAP